jgi:inosine-uridine nucleoside N-ribohydrolase
MIASAHLLFFYSSTVLSAATIDPENVTGLPAAIRDLKVSSELLSRSRHKRIPVNRRPTLVYNVTINADQFKLATGKTWTRERVMRRRLPLLMIIMLSLIVLLLLLSGPLLRTLGVEVICIRSVDGRWRVERCSGETKLAADTSPPNLSANARPILIDTDMAADDWMAILYLLQRPDVDVRAITVTGAGEAHCAPGVRNALNLAAIAGRPEIPVTCGRTSPLSGDHVFPPSWRDHVDALAGIKIPANPNGPHGQDAVGLIAHTVDDAAGELQIITLGPLTNLAEALLDDPALAQTIGQIYIMGGAFSVPGNVSDASEMGIDNSAAEWNIYIDPQAAAVVVASGAPLTFVPLDATNHVPLDDAFYHRLSRDRSTPEAEFVYRVLTQNIGFVRSGDYYFWDPLTAAVALDESLSTFETRSVLVIEREGKESGATRLDPAGSPVRITTAAAGEQFKQQFLDVLNGRMVE